MDKVFKIANLYVATLRQIYLTHQFAHWTTRGEPFYGDHQLFERLYKSAADDADAAAERMIGLFGADGVDYDMQADFMTKLATKYSVLKDKPAELSLKIETDFIVYSDEAYATFDEEGVLSLGLDDLLMSIASNRETAVYLLKQKLNKLLKI